MGDEQFASVVPEIWAKERGRRRVLIVVLLEGDGVLALQAMSYIRAA